MIIQKTLRRVGQREKQIKAHPHLMKINDWAVKASKNKELLTQMFIDLMSLELEFSTMADDIEVYENRFVAMERAIDAKDDKIRELTEINKRLIENAEL